MSIDKFGQHILHNQIKEYGSAHPRPYKCVLYIHGKHKGSQKFQDPLYTFILKNNTVTYTIPIEGIIDNIVYFPTDINYHYNKSTQNRMRSLPGKRVFKGDTFVFTSRKNYTDEALYIEITLKCV